MQTLYEVHGDHPVLRRVDEKTLTEVDKNDLVAELKRLKYENIEVKSDIYYEAGDEIEIQYNDLYNLNKEARSLLDGVINIKANYNVTPIFPLKCKLVPKRMDRKRIYLTAEWEIVTDGIAGKKYKTNVYGLRSFMKFIEPESEEIPLMNADDEILYEHELVVKHYALQNKVSEKDAQEVIDKVQSAMGAKGIVFYRP